MKRIISIILLTAFCVSLCACQPTPEEPFVVNKNDGKLEAAIHSDESPKNKYDFPTEWRDESFESSDGNTTIIIDAKIKTPDVDAFPVYYVSPDDAMTQEYADVYLDYFFGDQKLYSPYTDDIQTKNDILDRIMQIEDEINNPESELNTSYSDEEYEWGLEARQKMLEYLREQYKSAPEEKEAKTVSREFQAVGEDGNISHYEIDGTSRDHAVSIYIRKDNVTRGPNRSRSVTVNTVAAGEPWVFSTTDISDYGMENYMVDTAKEVADKVMNDLGKTDYSVVSVGSCNVHFELMTEPDMTYLTLPRAYMFYYTKLVDDIPVLLTFDDMFADSTYSQNDWTDEYIAVAVSNEGFCYYFETSSLKLIEKVNENIKLMEFGKIQEIFRNYIAMEVSYFDDNQAIKSREVLIDDVRLGYVKIAEKNRTDRAYLMPVWIFYGDETEKYDSQNDTQLILNENNEYTAQDNIAHAYLCINAIDGSIIDLTKGY